MAARNPTSYTNWIDERLLTPSENILSATPGYVLNDQVYVLDQPVMIVSWTGLMDDESGSSFVTKQYFYVHNKDMCDVDTVTNDEIPCAVYVHHGRAGNTGEVKISSTAVASNTVTIATASGWNQAGSDLNVKTNNIEDTLTIELRRTSGVGGYFISSLLVIAKET